MGAQMMSVEAEMDGIIQTYGRRIGEVGVHWNLAKERDGISKELCNGIRRAKDLSYKTAKDTDNNYIKLGVELCSIKRLALPKFNCQPRTWPEFYRSLTVILGMYDPAMLMIGMRDAMPQATNHIIMGITNPTEAWTIFDRRFGNKDITIATTITKFLALKIHKGPKLEQMIALI